MYRLTENEVLAGIAMLPQKEIESAIDAIYNDLEGSEDAEEYHRRHMTESLGILTVFRQEKARELVKPIRQRILNKSVVEIGAGVGLFAIEMARYANSVIAIESDPAWSWVFAKHLYSAKPERLTWILGRAESVAQFIKADIAIIVTHSGQEAMKQVASRMASEVIDYYQEYPR